MYVSKIRPSTYDAHFVIEESEKFYIAKTMQILNFCIGFIEKYEKNGDGTLVDCKIDDFLAAYDILKYIAEQDIVIEDVADE